MGLRGRICVLKLNLYSPNCLRVSRCICIELLWRDLPIKKRRPRLRCGRRRQKVGRGASRQASQATPSQSKPACVSLTTLMYDSDPRHANREWIFFALHWQGHFSGPVEGEMITF
jgi:hypothetical protein